MAQVVLEKEGGGVRLTRRLTLGCELSCTTINGDVFRGNLVAEDEEAMLLVIKEASSEVSPVVGDNSSGVHIINLQNATKLEVLDEPLTPPTGYTHLPKLDVDRIRRRLEANTEAKWKEIRSQGINVSDEAQQLFNYISRMHDDIEWDKDVIVVLNDVKISPPYAPENCSGSQQACEWIKKQVVKFHKETGVF